MKFLPLAIVAQVFIGGFIGAQQPGNEPDFYDRMAHLLSGLQAMQNNSRSLQTSENSGLETINIEDDFIAYDVQVVDSEDSSRLLKVSLDPFDGVITSHLTYRLRVAEGGTIQIQIDNPIFENDGMLYYDDSLLIDVHGRNTLTDVDIAYLGNRLNVFRTMGLKANLQQVSSHDASEALLVVHGRNNDSLHYSSSVNLLNTMRRISGGTHVYAIPARLDLWQDRMYAQYYVIISDLDQGNHHYLQVTDYCTRGAERITCDRTEVHMYPFIQRNNPHPDMVNKNQD